MSDEENNKGLDRGVVEHDLGGDGLSGAELLVHNSLDGDSPEDGRLDPEPTGDGNLRSVLNAANIPVATDVRETVDETLHERGRRYGQFRNTADIAQGLKMVIRNAEGWRRMSATQREGLENICIKISRIVSGDPHYKDNWVDIGGYARLVERNLKDG